MKRYAIAGTLAVAVVVGGNYLLNSDIGKETFEAVQAPQTVEIVTEVDKLDALIKTRLEAESGRIHDAGEAARVAAEEAIRTDIELEVRQAYRKELEATEAELEKKTGAY